MIAPEDVVLVLLAAGQSARFGEGDKLAAQVSGVPLALHVVTALEDVPFKRRIAVVSNTAVAFANHGFDIVDNPSPENGMGLSLRLGVEGALRFDPLAILVALADMPRVTADHVHRLLADGDGPDTLLASSDGSRPSPPALFGAAHFDALLRSTGDKGARDLIAGARHVLARADELVDIDTIDDLERLRAR